MISESKLITIIGVAIAIAAVFATPENSPSLTALLGEAAAAKIAAFGAVVSAIGGSILNILKPKVTP
jgi:hypothetical protein